MRSTLLPPLTQRKLWQLRTRAPVVRVARTAGVRNGDVIAWLRGVELSGDRGRRIEEALRRLEVDQ